MKQKVDTESMPRFSMFWFWIMVFNATFINISVISWPSILLVEENGENHRPVASHWQTFITWCCIEYTSQWTRFKLTTLVVIGTNCTGSCKSIYHRSQPWWPCPRCSKTQTEYNFILWNEGRRLIELNYLCLSQCGKICVKV